MRVSIAVEAGFSVCCTKCFTRSIKQSLGFLEVKRRNQLKFFFLQYSKDQTILPGDNQSNTLTLRVGRGSLVADALRQLSQVEDIDLSKVLVVQ
jgi:hypothetical protein